MAAFFFEPPIYDFEYLFPEEFPFDYTDFFIYDTIEPIYETGKTKLSDAVSTGKNFLPFPKDKPNPVQNTVKPKIIAKEPVKEPEKPKPVIKKEAKKEETTDIKPKEKNTKKRPSPRKSPKKKESFFTNFPSLETIFLVLGGFILTAIIGVCAFLYFYNGYRQAEDRTRMADHMRSLTRPRIEPDNDDEKIKKTIRYG